MEESPVKIYVLRSLSLAIGLIALGATAVSAADVEKFFDRAGNLVVQEKVAKYKRRADEGKIYPVPPPPFSEDIFPCSDCHADLEPNPERRCTGAQLGRIDGVRVLPPAARRVGAECTAWIPAVS